MILTVKHNNKFLRGFFSALLLSTPMFCAAPFSANAAEKLLEHRAVYDVSLNNADERTGLAAMNGIMAYGFQGSTCDGYTTNFRFAVKVANGDNEFVSDQTASTYESADGDEFSFSDRSYLNNQLENEVKGSATKTDDGVRVKIRIPNELDLTLKPAIFPTQHIKNIIAKALAGESFYRAYVYDAADDGDKVLLSTTVIGKPKNTIKKTNVEYKVLGDFREKTYWPITISYFEALEKKEEAIPTYQISFKLYENGMTRDLLLDYGDYRLIGSLKKLIMLPKTTCKVD